MNWQNFNSYIDKGSGGNQAITAAGIGLRENNIRSDGTPGWECTDPTAALAILQAFDQLAYEKSSALARLADKRWTVMNNGHMTTLGVAVKTDTDSLTLITGASGRASSGVQTSFSFKAADGSWHTIDAATMTSLYNDVAAFIQACFNNEKTLADQINALTDPIAAKQFNVNTGWPT